MYARSLGLLPLLALLAGLRYPGALQQPISRAQADSLLWGPYELNAVTAATLTRQLSLPSEDAEALLNSRRYLGAFRDIGDLQRVQGLSRKFQSGWGRRQLWVHPDSSYRLALAQAARPTPRWDARRYLDSTALLQGLVPTAVLMRMQARKAQLGQLCYWPQLAGRSRADARWLPVLQRALYLRPCLLDLNRASEAELALLPGFTRLLAARVVRMRQALGFFHESGQLLWHYPHEAGRLQQALPYLYLGPLAGYPRLPLNPDRPEQLARHPYLTRQEAEAIVAFRRRYGDFPHAEAWAAVPALTSARFRQVRPYLP